MSINAETLRRLSALQLAPEAMQEILSIIASCIEPLEQRRRRDRDRKSGKSMEIPQTFRGNSPEIPVENPPQHITTPQVQKPKKVSVSIDASNLPTTCPEAELEYAKGHGWDQSKIDLEWQRFRDSGLAKGRKYKNIPASWRNWVTSPYQSQPSGTVHAQTNQHHPAGAYGASKDRFREAFAELKAFNAGQRGSTGDGEIVELLPPARRERA